MRRRLDTSRIPNAGDQPPRLMPLPYNQFSRHPHRSPTRLVLLHSREHSHSLSRTALPSTATTTWSAPQNSSSCSSPPRPRVPPLIVTRSRPPTSRRTTTRPSSPPTQRSPPAATMAMASRRWHRQVTAARRSTTHRLTATTRPYRRRCRWPRLPAIRQLRRLRTRPPR